MISNKQINGAHKPAIQQLIVVKSKKYYFILNLYIQYII